MARRVEHRLLTVEEAAWSLGITPAGVRDRIRKGTLPARKEGRRYLVSPGDVLASAGVSKALGHYLCKSLAAAISEKLGSQDETVRVLQEQLTAALDREAEANRLLGAAREQAKLYRAWAVRAEQELGAFKVLHGMKLLPGTTVYLENGAVLGTAGGEIPPGR